MTTGRLIEIVRASVEVPEDERSACLDRLCGDDAVLRARAEEALRVAADLPQEGGGFVVLPDEREELAPGTRVGAYTIERLIGRGGMGLVYEARQETPERVVALKMMGVQTPSRLARQYFEREIEFVASQVTQVELDRYLKSF